MDWQNLVSAETLRTQLDQPGLAIIDCRFDLRDPGAAERTYLAGHVAGASFAHLDRDLSDLQKTGRGRHPLPDIDAFCQALARWGVTPDHQVVAYDARDGQFAARLWWLLRLLGHTRAAVLDGGMEAWVSIGGRLETGPAKNRNGRYSGRFNSRLVASTAVVAARLASENIVLIDARATERFRGDIEPLDRVAGHIPGAVNRPYMSNLDDSHRFKSSEQLAREFNTLLGHRPPSEAVLMCGSGVTACHNLLAMEHAGLYGARVYAGSWSEWCADPARPVARGE